MRIQQLTLKHFRCFADTTVVLDAPIVLLCGPNGSGKTSILEGIHYLCYLRSFRTSSPADMLAFGQPAFFVRAQLTLPDETSSDVQVGVAGKKRLLKINQRPIQSYKELMGHYRVVTITQDDIELVSGEPAHRRLFLDHALMMADLSFIPLAQQYRHILEQRNALLSSSSPLESYQVWTSSLWNVAIAITAQRQAYLKQLEQMVNQLLAQFFDTAWSVALEYQPRIPLGERVEDILTSSSLRAQEMRYGRTLFGPHLDDIKILFKSQHSRTHASRGQQRLVAALLRIAHVHLMQQIHGPCVLLLDDIMTDFDEQVLEQLLQLLAATPGQRIFTAPYQHGQGVTVLQRQGALLKNISD